MTTKAFVYRRFSSDEQEFGAGGASETLARQSQACEAFARQQGWTVVKTLTDKGRSAFRGEHLLPDADLGKFVAAVERGEIQNVVLVAERLDRLSRRPIEEAMAWMHSLRSRGIQIALADTKQVLGQATMSLETFLGTAIRASLNHEESAKKSERVLSAKRTLWQLAERKEGQWINLAARPPLWLKRNAERNDWIVDKHRRKIVNYVYEWSADGLGATSIAQRLNATGEQPWGVARVRKGPGWGRTSIRQLLDNPAVEGDFVGESGQFAGKVLHDFYPRIVDADLVQRARANQKARKRVKGARVSVGTVNLFAGLMFCGECARPAYLTSSISKGKEYTYVRCENAGDGRCTNNLYYPYQPFEDGALDLCLDLALDDRFFAATGELRDAKIKAAELDKKIADKTAQRERMLGDYYKRPNGDPLMKQMMDRLGDEIDALIKARADIQAEMERASGKVGQAEHLNRVRDIREAAKSDDHLVATQARSKLRQAFSAIMSGVEVDRDGNTGAKAFTVMFLGGILNVRFNAKGKIMRPISDALGKPLWQHLPPDQRTQAEPLIRRIEALMEAA